MMNKQLRIRKKMVFATIASVTMVGVSFFFTSAVSAEELLETMPEEVLQEEVIFQEENCFEGEEVINDVAYEEETIYQEEPFYEDVNWVAGISDEEVTSFEEMPQEEELVAGEEFVEGTEGAETFVEGNNDEVIYDETNREPEEFVGDDTLYDDPYGDDPYGDDPFGDEDFDKDEFNDPTGQKARLNSLPQYPDQYVSTDDLFDFYKTTGKKVGIYELQPGRTYYMHYQPCSMFSVFYKKDFFVTIDKVWEQKRGGVVGWFGDFTKRTIQYTDAETHEVCFNRPLSPELTFYELEKIEKITDPSIKNEFK